MSTLPDLPPTIFPALPDLPECEWVVDVTEDVTLGELSRRQDRFEKATRDNLKAIDDRFATVVSRDAYQERHQALVDRVIDLERENALRSGHLWALGIALAASVLSAIAAIIIALIH